MTDEIRKLRLVEIALVLDWAAAEGWNPGLDDAAAFHAADPEGFLGLFADGELASAVSAVRYGDGFGFIGLYICRPAWRGQGRGKGIWDAGMARLAGRVIGLDGVVAQQANYVKEGFAYAHRNVRYAGKAPKPDSHPAVLELGPGAPPGMVEAVVDYDRRFFPDRRDAFLRSWIAGRARRGVAFVGGGSVAGYGVIRECRSGYKVGPLFADNEEIAEALFASLVAPHEGEVVALDLPVPNVAAVALARRHGLEPAFETARMYRGKLPALPLDRIFGITTFELG